MAGTITVGELLSDPSSSNKITIGTGTTLDLVSGAGSVTMPSASLTGALPALDGSALTNMAAGGKVLQVVHYSNATGVTFPQNTTVTTEIISGAITPSATSSKILTIQYLDLALSGGNYPAVHIAFNRGSTQLTFGNHLGYMDTETRDRRFQVTKIHLDSPFTTSQITYYSYGGNTSGSGFSGTYNGRGNVASPSTLTLIEIAG